LKIIVYFELYGNFYLKLEDFRTSKFGFNYANIKGVNG